MRRRDGGQPLRDAMAAAGLGLQDVAAATRELDGEGISFQLVAFLATTRPWARETTSHRTAMLIEKALGVPQGTLFEHHEEER
jgi:hypothetical protein